MILRELVLSYRPARDAQDHPIPCPSVPIRDPATAVPLLMQLLASEPHEVIGALYVNTRYQVLGWRVLARGSLDAVVVTPREILQAGLLLNAKGLLLAHFVPWNKMRLLCHGPLRGRSKDIPLSTVEQTALRT
ncbi:MAG: JAB domain-containing protein [Vicinamibacteraceae bacterium]